MDKNFYITFDTCPNCGSALQFLKELSQELKDRGLARLNWNMRFDSRTGVVMDQSRTIMLPIGVKLPGYSIATDICMDCGTIYAVELRRIEGETKATPPPTNPLSSQGRNN